jgi:predicted metal-dependent phosphoesterase TrpH
MQSRHGNRVDLHIHSTASDGTCDPSEVVRMAAGVGLTTIAITDHDTTDGLPEAFDEARRLGLDVMPGVEVNSEGEWGDLHILGYCFDTDDSQLVERLREVQIAREARARRILDRLATLGMHLEWADILSLTRGKIIGRPHIARALVSRGHVASVREAFERFIGVGGPAYVARLRMRPDEVIGMIRAAGGVPVLAHPIQSGAMGAIPELVRQGIRGLEVYYPGLSPSDICMLEEWCSKMRLIATGGSDFHGPLVTSVGSGLGTVTVFQETVELLASEAREIRSELR